MTTTHLSAEAIRGALTIRDLTDRDQGPHGIQLLIDELEEHLSSRWTVPVRRARAHPVVSVAENYDRLLIPRDAIAREARYTRYLNDEAVLRTHTSAMIPALLEELAQAPDDLDVLLLCPGLVYRRDSIGRQHVGEPHQMDLWRIRTASPALTTDDLVERFGDPVLKLEAQAHSIEVAIKIAQRINSIRPSRRAGLWRQTCAQAIEAHQDLQQRVSIRFEAPSDLKAWERAHFVDLQPIWRTQPQGSASRKSLREGE